jgi:hypothetical protein
LFDNLVDEIATPLEDETAYGDYYFLFGFILLNTFSVWGTPTMNSSFHQTLHDAVKDFTNLVLASTKYIQLKAMLENEWDFVKRQDGRPVSAARGSYGEVFQIKKRSDGDHICALKIFIPRLHTPLETLEEEVRFHGRLEGHVGVGQLEDYDMSPLYSWMMTEWIPGCNLEQFGVMRDSELSSLPHYSDSKEDQAMKFLATLLPTILHFQMKTVCHGDIKRKCLFCQCWPPHPTSLRQN